MSSPLNFPTADGTVRPAVTPAEIAYARALHELAQLRPRIGQAVAEESAAAKVLHRALRELGAIHPETNRALQVWRGARAARRRAETEVEAGQYRLEDAIELLGRETAGVAA